MTVAGGQEATASSHAAERGIFVGTSGWAYATWKPGFYPADVPAKRFLQHYSTQLNSVEVNYTFRSLPTAAILAGWLAAVPAEFRFSFKAPQRITHFSRLLSCHAAVGKLIAALEPVHAAGRLGPLLFQLPPNFKAAPERLAEFLSAPALTGVSAPRIAFEFRHESWFTEEVYSILRAGNAALCVAERDELQTPDVLCASTHACYRLRCGGEYSDAPSQCLRKGYVRMQKAERSSPTSSMRMNRQARWTPSRCSRSVQPGQGSGERAGERREYEA